MRAGDQKLNILLEWPYYSGMSPSLVPRLLPYRKTGREQGRSDHVPRDVLCVVLCVVLIIELLPTQSVLSVVSADTAVVVCR